MYLVLSGIRKSCYIFLTLSSLLFCLLPAYGHFQRLQLPNCNTLKDVARNNCKLLYFGDMDNLQTSRLGDRGLDRAMEQLRDMFWIGITELFDASICLLSYQLGQYRVTECGCEARAQKLSKVPVKNPLRKRYNVSVADILHIDYITYLDEQLYHYGLRLFLRRVYNAEQSFGRPFLCKGVDHDDVIELKLKIYDMSL